MTKIPLHPVEDGPGAGVAVEVTVRVMVGPERSTVIVRRGQEPVALYDVREHGREVEGSARRSRRPCARGCAGGLARAARPPPGSGATPTARAPGGPAPGRPWPAGRGAVAAPGPAGERLPQRGAGRPPGLAVEVGVDEAPPERVEVVPLQGHAPRRTLAFLPGELGLEELVGLRGLSPVPDHILVGLVGQAHDVGEGAADVGLVVAHRTLTSCGRESAASAARWSRQAWATTLPGSAP